MKTLIAILVTFFFANKTSAQKNGAVTGKIVTENKEGQIKLRAVASNQSDLYSNLT